MFQVSQKERQIFLRISLKVDLVEDFMLQPRLNLPNLKSQLVNQHSRKEKMSLLLEQAQHLIALMEKILVEMTEASKKAEGLQRQIVQDFRIMEPIVGASAMLGLLLMSVDQEPLANLLMFWLILQVVRQPIFSLQLLYHLPLLKLIEPKKDVAIRSVMKVASLNWMIHQH